MKGFEEICKEADENRTDIKALTELWTYTLNRKNCFTPSHFEFIREHLNKYAKQIVKEEKQKAEKQKWEDDN